MALRANNCGATGHNPHVHKPREVLTKTAALTERLNFLVSWLEVTQSSCDALPYSQGQGLKAAMADRQELVLQTQRNVRRR